MKTAIIAITLTAAAIVGCGASAQESQQSKPTKCSVELNGDSVLFGFINDEASGWRLPTTPAQWLRNHGYTVTDKTAGGLRTYDMVRGYEKPFNDAWPVLYPNGQQRAFWIEPHDSKIVVIQTGINDFRTTPFSARQVAQDYRYLVDWLRGAGKEPVITGVINMDQSRMDADSYAKIAAIRTAVRQVAVEKSVPYAGFDEVPLAWTDGIHLDQASSNGIADKLRATLDAVCTQKTPINAWFY